MAPKPLPKLGALILVGDSVELRDVMLLQKMGFAMTRRSLVKMLRSLRVPLVFLKDRAYFSLTALEDAFFLLTYIGAPGFIAPASKMKQVMSGRKGKFSSRAVTEISDELLSSLPDLRSRMDQIAKERGRSAVAVVNRMVRKIERMMNAEREQPASGRRRRGR